ncbi:MAG: bifunctional precorrin-2 dehydrogenase/sirohydrochlorin ferrochelatase [Tissierellia bacterium]|nr:bifunctional precorrin-2 dehydrogenase/sirohydrochlorin ferrochelatase [Tissierellia bacterium]
MYPLLLNIRNKKILFIGGGAVAERRLARVLAEGGIVTLISPQITPGIQDFIEEGADLDWVPEPYSNQEIDVYNLVFICTDDPNINEAVSQRANQLGIWVNRADDQAASDFSVPAEISLGGIHLYHSTDGLAPFLSSYIRRDLESRYQRFDREYVQLLHEIRILQRESAASEAVEDLYALIELTKEDLRDLLRELSEL